MKCPHCNQEHPDEFLFCPITGNKIVTNVPYANGNLHDYDHIDSFYEGRSIVSKDGKYGVIDLNGSVMVPCKYSKILRFSEGVAACQVESGCWSFMNRMGHIVLSLPDGLDVISDIGFKEGLCAVSGYVEDEEDNSELKYGFIDKNGNLVIGLQYDYANDYNDGLAVVSIDGEDGDYQIYINKAGEQAIPYDYCACHDFVGNYAVAKIESGKWVVIDQNARLIFKLINKESKWVDIGADFVSYGLGEKQLWFRPDNPEKHFFGNNVKSIWSGFSEGYIAVLSSIYNKWGYVSGQGEEAIPFVYDEAHNFKEGLAAVKIGDLWGYVDYNGTMVIKPIYDEATDFCETRAIVKKDDKYIVIDKFGNICF